MGKSAPWRIVWDSHDACYRICELTKQGKISAPLILDSESDRWQQWLEQVSSFAFHSKAGEHFTARKERRAQGGAYWTVYRKVDGRLKRKYLGFSGNVTLTRLEQIADALSSLPTDNAARVTAPAPTDGSSIRKQLLATKFFVPTSSHPLVNRPQLEHLLNEVVRVPLLLVSAPAGFGKTTLLAHWVHAHASHLVAAPRVAWLSLDKGDNNLVRFWTYVLTALIQHEPELGTALDMLQSFCKCALQEPEMEKVLTTLINTLSQTSQTYVLILDDYFLTDNPAIHASLNYLIEHQPPQLHIMITTRVDPPLNLSRLRARGHLLEVRTDQLRCTQEEAIAFLKGAMGLDLPTEILQEIVERTEGWLVGLQLLGLSLQSHPDPTKLLALLSGNQRYILDYLTEEVLQHQPPTIQKFLLHSSVLEQLTAPLCDSLLERNDSQHMLEELERVNLFIMPLDGHCHYYRYHGLFAEALRTRLAQEQPELIPHLHLRASHWYADHQFLIQAVHHALLAHAWLRAADLIEAFTEVLLWRQYEETWSNQEKMPLVLHWLRQIPSDVLQSRPRLALFYARNLFFAGDFSATIRWTQAAETALMASSTTVSTGYLAPAESLQMTQALSEQERELLLGEAAARKAIVTALAGEHQIAQNHAQHALGYLREQDRLQRAVAIAALGQAAFATGQIVPATYALQTVVSLVRDLEMPDATINFLCITASFLRLQGKLHAASQLFQQAIELGSASRSRPLAIVCNAYIGLADVLREWNQLTEAQTLAEEGIRFVNHANYLLNIDQSYLVLVRLALVRGELTTAHDEFQRTLHLPILAHNPYRRSWLTSMEQVLLWLRQGEKERARQWAEHLEHTERPHAPLAREREEVARARVLLALHQPDKARRLLEQCLRKAIATGRGEHILEMRVLQAIALEMVHAEQEALTVLAQAIQMAAGEGYLRRFVDEGPVMATLLSRLREQQRRTGEPTTYLDHVLTAFPSNSVKEAKTAKLQVKLPDPLSNRELEVLAELAHGASNQEIAATLVIAVETVKRHVGNILGKLDVNNRTQAVTRAQSLGLLHDKQS